MTARPLSGAEINALITELSSRLAPGGSQHTLIVVGGSLLALRGLRDTTEDVDSARPIDEELQQAAADIAAIHGLDPRWLNADAAMFLPATFDTRDCDVLLDHPRLLVLGAAMRDVFVMKMYRADANDLADMVVMWPETGFRTAHEVVGAYVAAYPHAPDDPHLDTLVIEVAKRAGADLPPG